LLSINIEELDTICSNWIVKIDSLEKERETSKSPLKMHLKTTTTPQPITKRMLTKSNMKQMEELSRINEKSRPESRESDKTKASQKPSRATNRQASTIAASSKRGDANSRLSSRGVSPIVDKAQSVATKASRNQEDDYFTVVSVKTSMKDAVDNTNKRVTR